MGVAFSATAKIIGFAIYVALDFRSLRKSMGHLNRTMSSVLADDVTKRMIGEKALRIVEPYVPYHTGALNSSGHVVYHARSVSLSWRAYDPRSGYNYAGVQYEGPDSGWNRDRTVHPLAKSHWTDVLKEEGHQDLVRVTTEIIQERVAEKWGA